MTRDMTHASMLNRAVYRIWLPTFRRHAGSDVKGRRLYRSQTRQLISMFKRLPWILLFSISFLLYGCMADSENSFYEHKVDAYGFSVYTPIGWRLFEDQGIDTHVGRIAGPEDTIRFDEGFMSFRSLEDIKEDEKTIYIEKLEIDGIPAVIHKTRLGPDYEKRIRLSVFIEAGYFRKNHLYVFDPSNPANEMIIINIFRSHEFQ